MPSFINSLSNFANVAAEAIANHVANPGGIAAAGGTAAGEAVANYLANRAAGALAGAAGNAAEGAVEQRNLPAQLRNSQSLMELSQRIFTPLSVNQLLGVGATAYTLPDDQNLPMPLGQGISSITINSHLNTPVRERSPVNETVAQSNCRRASMAAASRWGGAMHLTAARRSANEFLSAAMSPALLERLGNHEGVAGKELLELVAGLVFTQEGSGSAGRSLLLHNAKQAFATLEESTDIDLWEACRTIAGSVGCGDSSSHRFTQIREAILAFDMRTSGRSLDEVFDGILQQLNQDIVEKAASRYAQKVGEPSEAVEYYMSLATRLKQKNETLLNTATGYLYDRRFTVDPQTVNQTLSEIRQQTSADNPELLKRFTEHPAFHEALQRTYNREYAALLAERDKRQDELEKTSEDTVMSSEELRERSHKVMTMQPEWLEQKSTEAFTHQMQRLEQRRGAEPVFDAVPSQLGLRPATAHIPSSASPEATVNQGDLQELMGQLLRLLEASTQSSSDQSRG